MDKTNIRFKFLPVTVEGIYYPHGFNENQYYKEYCKEYNEDDYFTNAMKQLYCFGAHLALNDLDTELNTEQIEALKYMYEAGVHHGLEQIYS